MTKLEQHRRIWQKKPVLQKIYQQEFFDRLTRYRVPGRTLEVGGGPGYYKEYQPEVISSDIQKTPWLDLVVDCQRIPFTDGSFANIVGLDVFHHISDPLSFLHEAARVLCPGGRLILVEPWITPFAYVVYRYLHQEACFLDWHPGEILGDEKDPFDANSAQPYLVFERYWEQIRETIPALSLVLIERFSLFAYLLSFGFKPVNLLPKGLYPIVSTVERATKPLWEHIAALRALIVVERRTE
jgi:SAM-dependent methyltransferase